MLRVNNIFKSIMGECNAYGQGSWAIFVRMQGCSEKCSYCDTKDSWDFKKGKEYSVDDIVKKVKEMDENIKHVLITGGEPLEQDKDDLKSLIRKLHESGYFVSIETNGLHDIKDFRSFQTSIIQDIKIGEHTIQTVENIKSFDDWDYIKIVISDYQEYEISKIFVNRAIRKISKNVNIYFSPNSSVKDMPYKLFNWMKNDTLIQMNRIKYNLQIHKCIFKDLKNEEN